MEFLEEKINFQYKSGTNYEVLLNGILEFIVNRGFQTFQESGKKVILIENTSEGFLKTELFLMVLSIFPNYIKDEDFFIYTTDKKIFKKYSSFLTKISRKQASTLEASSFIFSTRTLEDLNDDEDYSHIDHYIFNGIETSTLLDIYDAFYRKEPMGG